MNKKYIVRLTDEERAICEATVKKETGKRSSTGWSALRSTGVPAAREVTPERAIETRTSFGQATPVESRATPPGLPRYRSRPRKEPCGVSAEFFVPRVP